MEMRFRDSYRISLEAKQLALQTRLLLVECLCIKKIDTVLPYVMCDM
jgi:hypothetical protein